jgi:hypothetical protein
MMANIALHRVVYQGSTAGMQHFLGLVTLCTSEVSSGALHCRARRHGGFFESTGSGP